VRDCPNCGTSVASSARFCHECGRPLAGDAEAEPARFRVTPALLVAAALTAAGAGLLVAAAWAWAFVAFLAALVVLLAAGPLRDGRARTLLAEVRTRASVTGESVAVRSRGHVELFRGRRELADLEAERGRRLLELGRAVYDGDERGTRTAREAVDATVAAIHEKEAEIETGRKEVVERVERAQSQARPTVVMETPPEPPNIPEPWPPPDEADRPSPEPDPGPVEPPAPPDEPGPTIQR
jgi:zinc-ribbon domain